MKFDELLEAFAFEAGLEDGDRVSRTIAVDGGLLHSARPLKSHAQSGEGGGLLEERYLGSKALDDIYILHFDENLASALSALDALEGLRLELRELHYTEMHANYIGSQLEVSEASEVAKDRHNRLSEGLQFQEIKKGLVLRLGHKLVDLMKFSLAAKKGGRILFSDRYPNDIDTASDYRTDDPVSQFREPLRKLVELQRTWAAKAQKKIVSISIRDAYDQGLLHYKVDELVDVDIAPELSDQKEIKIADPFLPPNSRNERPFRHKRFRIDLRRFRFPKNARIKRVGTVLKTLASQTSEKAGIYDSFLGRTRRVWVRTSYEPSRIVRYAVKENLWDPEPPPNATARAKINSDGSIKFSTWSDRNRGTSAKVKRKTFRSSDANVLTFEHNTLATRRAEVVWSGDPSWVNLDPAGTILCNLDRENFPGDPSVDCLILFEIEFIK